MGTRALVLNVQRALKLEQGAWHVGDCVVVGYVHSGGGESAAGIVSSKEYLDEGLIPGMLPLRGHVRAERATAAASTTARLCHRLEGRSRRRGFALNLHPGTCESQRARK